MADFRSRSAQLFTAVGLDAAGQLADHDLAGFDHKGHFAAGQHARRDANVLGNGDLALFSDMHRCFFRLSATKYELEVGIIQVAPGHGQQFLEPLLPWPQAREHVGDARHYGICSKAFIRSKSTRLNSSHSS